jgi:hypothetical protein
VGAPLIVLVWGVATFIAFGAAAVVVTYTVCTIAHHFPTFLRIYTDADLLRRYRWSLLLGPLIPFSLAMCVVAQAIRNDYGPEYLLFMMMILTLWDPWHFLMQHYGFMRIYDRPNLAPRTVAARMDLMISALWYLFILVAAANWLPDLLYRFYSDHGMRLLHLFESGVYAAVQVTLLLAALLGTVAYIAYVGWCYYHGFYVSCVKLVLLVLTFSVMYLAYVPNSLMGRLQPEWTFPVGFAVVNMAHVTQYLAIVWKYNRSLAARGARFRGPRLQVAFSRGGALIAVAYVAVCLCYGLGISEPGQRPVTQVLGSVLAWAGMEGAVRWYAGLSFALGFTSTLLHYYYDGFIWKVRHQENRVNLAMEQGTGGCVQPAISWWDSRNTASAGKTLLKQGLYFGVPILLLWITYAARRGSPDLQAIQQLKTAVQMHREGKEQAGYELAMQALAASQRQLDIEWRMLEIRTVAKHYAHIGHLRYWRARAANEVFRAADPDRAAQTQYWELMEAARALEHALKYPGPYAHAEAARWSRDDVETMLAQCREQARALVPAHSSN